MSSVSRKPRRRYEPHQIIIARGDEVRGFLLRRWMIALAAVLVLGVAFWTAALTAYVVFRDDVLAAMMARQTRMQHAYEDRIATLRLQIDRVTSRQLIDQEAIAARMEDLARRQQSLDQRTNAMSTVVDRARQSNVAPPAPQTPPQQRSAIVPSDDIVTGSLERPARLTGNAIERTRNVRETLAALDERLGRAAFAHEQMLGQIETRTRETETRIRTVVRELGIDPDRIAGPRPRPAAPPPRPQTQAQQGGFTLQGAGVGGPFVPLAVGDPAGFEAFELRSRQLMEEMAHLERLRRGLSVVPVRRPVRGEPDISSGFGPRRDPFLGVMAFHSGMDFRGDTGEPVIATAAGTITHAGRNGGYGLTVDIDHGNGLTTRYAHLSAILVQDGARVQAGQQIGRIGSTGRSTGPHLHYETRVEGEAVNPDRFMRAGQRLGMW